MIYFIFHPFITYPLMSILPILLPYYTRGQEGPRGILWYVSSTSSSFPILSPFFSSFPGLLTFPVGLRVVEGVLLLLPEGVESEVCQLEDEARVHHTIGRLEVPVGTDLTRV